MALNLGQTLMGVTWWLVGMTIIALALRFYVRVLLSRQVGSDDYMMLVAGILVLTAEILVTDLFETGLGRTDDLSMPQKIHIAKFEWIFTVPVCASSIFSRISTAILLGRIFSVKRWFRWYLISTALISSCLVTALIVELMASCTPIEGLWNPSIAATARCLNPSIFQYLGYASQSVLTLTDITFVLFPVIFVWKLHIDMKRRLGLILIFSLGILTAVASIMKMVMVQSTSTQKTSLSGTIPSILCTTSEANMVITLGCIPTLGPLTRVRFTRWRQYLSGRRSRTKTHTPLPESMAPIGPNFSAQISSRKHPRYYHEFDTEIDSMNRDMLATATSAEQDYPASTTKMKIHRNHSFTLSYEKKPNSGGEV